MKRMKNIIHSKGCAHGYYAKSNECILMYVIQGNYIQKMQTGINIKDRLFKDIISKKSKIVQSDNDKKLPLLNRT